VVRVFVTKWFARFARKERINEEDLCDAVERAGRGSIDANLGGGLIKQRVARAGGGRSSGFRMVLAFRAAERSVFLYGFAKNERENIGDRELADLKKLASKYLSLSGAQVEAALSEAELKELSCDGEKNQ